MRLHLRLQVDLVVSCPREVDLAWTDDAAVAAVCDGVARALPAGVAAAGRPPLSVRHDVTTVASLTPTGESRLVAVLSREPPVSIDEGDWPLVSHVELRPIELSVRRCDDGRSIVSGFRFTHERPIGVRHGESRGYLVPPGGGLAAVGDACVRVVDELLEGVDDDDLARNRGQYRSLAHRAVASMPPRILTCGH